MEKLTLEELTKKVAELEERLKNLEEKHPFTSFEGRPHNPRIGLTIEEATQKTPLTTTNWTAHEAITLTKSRIGYSQAGMFQKIVDISMRVTCFVFRPFCSFAGSGLKGKVK